MHKNFKTISCNECQYLDCGNHPVGYWPDGYNKRAYCEVHRPRIESALEVFGDQKIKAHYCTNYV